MFKYLNRKTAILLFAVAMFLVSIAGGALGAVFGLGFLSSPLPVISLAAEPAFHIGDVSIYNTTIMLLISGAVLVILSWRATRRINDVPTGLQNVFEVIYEFFRGMAREMGGKKAYRFLPVVVLVFFMVLFSNWLGIVPGVGTFGRVETIEEWVDIHSKAELNNPDYAYKYENLGEENKVLVSRLEVLIHYQSELFVVFGGNNILTSIPFGRGEDAKAPLSSIVPIPLEDIKHIADTVEHGEPLDEEQMRLLGDIDSYIAVGKPQEPYIGKSGNIYNCAGERIDSFTPCAESDKNPAGVLIPFLRGASTDLNTTLALALIAITAIQFFGIRALGFFGYTSRFFNFKGGVIGLFVGVLELFAEVARVISFTFRLFGNMFAGEILLIVIGFLLPLVGIIPFLGLELFVGLVQAFIFATLILVFSVMATISHSDHE